MSVCVSVWVRLYHKLMKKNLIKHMHVHSKQKSVLILQ